MQYIYQVHISSALSCHACVHIGLYTHTHAHTHNTYTQRHRYRYRHTHTHWAISMEQRGYSVNVILIWLRVDMGFMLSPVYQGPRKSTSFFSEFYPEKKKMKKTQRGKAVQLGQAQGLIHFSKKQHSVMLVFLPFLWKQGISLKTSEWSSSLVS